MSHARPWLAALTLLAPAALALQAEEPRGLLAESQIVQAAEQTAPSPAVPSAAGPAAGRMPYMPMTMELDENGFPPPGPPYSLFSPFEVYARLGPSFVLGSSDIDRVLRSGVSLTGGARSFLFNTNATAAWTSDLGLEYIYNDAQSLETILTTTGKVTVTRFGQPVTLPMTAGFGLRELHRTSAKLALGREWYFGGEEWGGVRLNFGLDGGGKYGHVSAKLNTNSRVIEGLQQFDTVPNFDDGHISAVNKGVFVGVNVGVLCPMNGYDLTFGARFEWGQDWFRRIADHAHGTDQIQTVFSFGARF